MCLVMIYYLLTFGFAGLVIKITLLESVVFYNKYIGVVFYSIVSAFYGVLCILTYMTLKNMPLPW